MSEEELQGDVEESEDLFGFDELFSRDGAPEQDAGKSDLPEGAQGVFDENDALFNFDELGAQADAEAINVSEILSDLPEEPQHAPPRPSSASGAESAPAPELVPTEPPRSSSEEPHQPARGSAREAGAALSVRSATLWVLLLFTAVNLGTIGFTWRASGKVKDEIGAATRYIIQATQEIQSQTGAHISKLQSFQSPVVADDPKHANSFERARSDMDRGDFQSAQRRLYSLLAIADRLDVDVRENIEATAHFMLADIAMQMAMAPREELP